MNSEIANEVLTELSVYPLTPSNYHKKLNCGSCHTFGLTARRGLPPQVSQVSHQRAKVYSLLVQLGDLLGLSDYTSISVYHNYTLVRRKEKQGGLAHIVLLGDYSDKGVQVLGKEGNIETTDNACQINTVSDCLVSSPVSSGNRFLVLYHKIGGTPFKPEFRGAGQSVSLVSGETPHNSNRYFFWREEREAIVSFD